MKSVLFLHCIMCTSLETWQWLSTHALVLLVAFNVLGCAGHEGDCPQDILTLLPYGWPQTVQQGYCFLNKT